MENKTKEIPDKWKLEYKQALDLLKPYLDGRKKRIHTYTKSFGMMMGCNVDLTDIKRRMKASNAIILTQYLGIRCAGHDVAFWDEKTGGYLMLDADREKIKTLFKEREI